MRDFLRPSWQRDQYMLAFVVSVTFLGFDFSTPFFPLYISELGDYSVEEVAFWSGVVIGMPPLISAFSGPFWGTFADRTGRRRVVAQAILAYGLGLFLMGHVTDLWQLVVLRALTGLFGGFTALVMALALARAPRERAGQVIGAIQMSQFLPLAAGPLVGGLIAKQYGLRLNFDLAGILCLVAFVFIFTVHDDPIPAPSVRGARPNLSLLAAIKLPGVGVAIVVLFLAQYAERVFMPLLPLFVQTLGASPEDVVVSAGLGLSAGAGGVAASGWLYGRLSARRPVRSLLICCLGAGAILAIPVALAPTVAWFLALRGTMALLAGGSIALAYTSAARAAPAGLSATVLTLLGSVSSAANASSPFVSGALAAFDLRTAFMLDTAIYLAALAAVIFWWKPGPLSSARAPQAPG